MDHLIDTNVLVLFLQDDPRLSRRLSDWIEDPGRNSFISLASLWEISIKSGLGKLRVAYADRLDLPELLEGAGFRLMPIGWPAIRKAGSLPLHHRDPFDRLLVAEAQLRGLPILSLDSKLDAYGIERFHR
ncbi:twitching motility protein PilT [Haloferula helveola]|uniref:Twitching motility protein PilT n=1 Tax=Haloferula helveola TaxID=490095 RepID=A0ABM7RIL7_9BACT|nr:twitching motility protein PilT [Haloferula helveola]